MPPFTTQPDGARRVPDLRAGTHVDLPATEPVLAATDLVVAGEHVWAFLPGAVDRWAVLGVDGHPVADLALDSSDGRARQVPLPDGGVLLGVSEGPDAARVALGRLTGDGIEYREYFPDLDRVLLDAAPDGGHFLTLDQYGLSLAVHRRTDGAVLVETSLAAFGLDADAHLLPAGGYLDAGAALVLTSVHTEEADWRQWHLLDTRTGQVLDDLDLPGDPDAVRPLGDGTWWDGQRRQVLSR
ncbi:hypothetical protein JOF53_001578 [Crossiella equi]|uniref:S9 family peptidase n=1 Tax=Crossiella equi TaxID=130796 RepID=A0ABS5A7Z4_9PSEU|nr:hypothetical protein [Crossiella equi]MBP2472706.1 hypothetical protein [Crossiella equi]